MLKAGFEGVLRRILLHDAHAQARKILRRDNDQAPELGWHGNIRTFRRLAGDFHA